MTFCIQVHASHRLPAVNFFTASGTAESPVQVRVFPGERHAKQFVHPIGIGNAAKPPTMVREAVMLDIRLITGKSPSLTPTQDESYWLQRLSETDTMTIGKDNFPLEFAVSLFNKDYVDLHIAGINIMVEIMPAGLAALRLRALPAS
jgi:hypothetical protein